VNMRKSKKKDKKGKVDRYLAIPYHILGMRDIGPGEKILLAHIHGFGARGCWSSNKTLGQMLQLSPCTISRMIGKIRRYVWIKNPKGYYRTIWSRSHPAVREAAAALRKTDPPARHCEASTLTENPAPTQNCVGMLGGNAQDPKQNCVGELSKSAIGLERNRLAINKETIKEINRDTTASAPPLPAHGQASPMLEAQRATDAAEIEQFTRSFGRGVKRSPGPTATRNIAQVQIKALYSKSGPAPPPYRPAEKPGPRTELTADERRQRSKEQIRRLRSSEQLRRPRAGAAEPKEPPPATQANPRDGPGDHPKPETAIAITTL